MIHSSGDSAAYPRNLSHEERDTTNQNNINKRQHGQKRHVAHPEEMSMKTIKSHNCVSIHAVSHVQWSQHHRRQSTDLTHWGKVVFNVTKKEILAYCCSHEIMRTFDDPIENFPPFYSYFMTLNWSAQLIDSEPGREWFQERHRMEANANMKTSYHLLEQVDKCPLNTVTI